MTGPGARRAAALLIAAVAVAALLAAPLLFAVQMRADGPEPHRAVLAVAGSGIVAQAMAERADALPGEPFDGLAVDSAAVARDAVRRGTAELGVAIDLGQQQDTLYVSTTTDPDLVAEYVSRLQAVSAGFGRSVGIQLVEPSAGASTSRRLPYLLTFGSVCVGVGLAVVLSLWRGPVAATTARGLLRLVGLAAASAAFGTVLALSTAGGAVPTRALAIAVVTAVAAWLVLALESVLELWGLALASAALLGLAAPLLTFVGADALPAPWREVLPWTPHGAALDLIRDLTYFDTSSARSWVKLACWAVVAVLTLVAARRNRPVRPAPAATRRAGSSGP